MEQKFLKTSLLGVSSLVGGLVACDNDNADMASKDFPEKPIMSRSSQTQSVAVPLSDDDSNYISTIQKIANDICNYPELAEEFVKDPQLYFSQYGYNGEISLDDGYVRFLTAYSDSEIRVTASLYGTIL